MRRRVVVTGIGPVTPVGVGVDRFWSSLIEGRSGIVPLTAIDSSQLAIKIGGQVPDDFDPTEWMSPKEVRRTDRVVHLAMAAAQLAHKDAGEPALDPARTGVLISTGIGGLGFFIENIRVFNEKGPDRVSPFTVPALMPNASAGQVAMHFGFSGPNACVTTACAAGGHGIGEAYRWIKDGLADACIAGGTENSLIPICLAAMAQAQAASKSTDAPHASRPFDANRNGFVLSEGATALILEEAEGAVARGARIYAEVAGYGASADAYHITAPHPEGIGAIQAMEACLLDAEEPPEAVEYVNAHGTSTRLNDAAETRAIKKVFGDHAYRLAVSSTKSMTGHLLGAAGALEAAATSLAIHTKTLPPTINYETPDPECDLDYVPNVARPADIRLATSNSFGFGGQNAVLALRRWDG
jgi:3-oxoacyl-[acyl-carrier-protein] synthase II